MPECTGKPLGDIGHDVSVELRYVDNELQGIEYRHLCGDVAPGQPDHRHPRLAWLPLNPPWPNGWDVLSAEPLTLSPSIRCRVCGHHGHIRNGRWEPA